MLIGIFIRGECEIPGRLIYKLEQSILKIFKFSIAGDMTIEQGWTTYSFLFLFFRKKMVQSAAMKQARLANSKHIRFFGLSGSYNKSSQIKVSHPVATIFNNDWGLRQTANLQCA